MQRASLLCISTADSIQMKGGAKRKRIDTEHCISSCLFERIDTKTLEKKFKLKYNSKKTLEYSKVNPRRFEI